MDAKVCGLLLRFRLPAQFEKGRRTGRDGTGRGSAGAKPIGRIIEDGSMGRDASVYSSAHRGESSRVDVDSRPLSFSPLSVFCSILYSTVGHGTAHGLSPPRPEYDRRAFSILLSQIVPRSLVCVLRICVL